MRADPPASLCAIIFSLATWVLCALTHLKRKILAVASRLLGGRRQCPVPQMANWERQQGVVARERSEPGPPDALHYFGDLIDSVTAQLARRSSPSQNIFH
jgi:hypothetical protein